MCTWISSSVLHIESRDDSEVAQVIQNIRFTHTLVRSGVEPHMKMKISIKTLMVVGPVIQLVSFSVHAEESCSDAVLRMEKEIAELKALLAVKDGALTSQPEPCSSLDLRSAKVGVRCTTPKGAIFERVSRENFGEAWKGPDGLIWSDWVGRGTHEDAVQMCKNIGGELPSNADFERGRMNEFREVLPGMKDRWFWSSSPHPKRSNDSYSFYPDHGIFEYGDRRLDDSVRCVGR